MAREKQTTKQKRKTPRRVLKKMFRILKANFTDDELTFNSRREFANLLKNRK